ncbi:hypothetical protein ACET3Z_020724 [Daucus carota]
MADQSSEKVEVAATVTDNNETMKGRKMSWAKLRRVDSLQMEAGRVSFTSTHANHSQASWGRTLSLAFQCLGVIYGDVGTSPLYVYSSTFTDGNIKENDDLLGVLSLIIYTLLLSPLIKYAFIVLRANDNGNGGTFALYSLISRHANMRLIPNNQPEDKELSNFRLNTPSSQFQRAEKIKSKLSKSMPAKIMLVMVTILGCSMVIGDGILTPSISVLSAVGGIKNKVDSLDQNAVVGISIAILVILFSAQRFGSDRVGYTFAPIIVVWFTFIGGIGFYNLFKHDITILRAFNPKYIIDYFKRNGEKGWKSLGGVVMCITGTEAMFADIGHFSVLAVQLSFTSVVLPALLATYIGQAAYLSKNPGDVADTFYASIPEKVYWPMFVVAVAAAIIASQAMISGAFAIISQALSLGCFPRVKVVHTSAKYEGQVYIPELNYMIMICSIFVTFTFKTTEKIGNAYGIAVVGVMFISTCLVSLIMLIIWKVKLWWIVLFFTVFGTLEGVYLSAVLSKFIQGGYLPIAFSLVLMSIMGIWHYVYVQRYKFELDNKVSASYIQDLATNPNINRVPGIGLLYSELVQGIPPIFPHFIENIPSIHSVLVFVSLKFIPISTVMLEERFLFRQVEPREYRMFRCVVRYGYKDKIEEPKEFENQLVENLKEFMRHEQYIVEAGNGITKDELMAPEPVHDTDVIQESADKADKVKGRTNSSTIHTEESLAQLNNSPRISSSSSIKSFRAAKSPNTSSKIISGPILGVGEELQFVQNAKEKGVVYLLGEADVIAKENSSVFNKIVVNYAYSFLRKNFRQGEKTMQIPQTRLLRVGMTYEI